MGLASAHRARSGTTAPTGLRRRLRARLGRMRTRRCRAAARHARLGMSALMRRRRLLRVRRGTTALRRACHAHCARTGRHARGLRQKTQLCALLGRTAGMGLASAHRARLGTTAQARLSVRLHLFGISFLSVFSTVFFFFFFFFFFSLPCALHALMLFPPEILFAYPIFILQLVLCCALLDTLPTTPALKIAWFVRS